MKRSERRALYECSTKGLINLINDPKYKNNKEAQFTDIVNYIARHEMYGGNTKSDLFDLIYTAKNELIAQEAKEHYDSKQPISYASVNNVSKKEDARIKQFIRDPIKSLRTEFTNLANRPDDENEIDVDKLIFNNRLEVNATTLFTEISVDSQRGAHEYGNHIERVDIMSRLTKKLPRDANVDKAIERVNGGFFGRLFRRPSKEYTAFEKSLNEFRDAGKLHSGNVDGLENKTTEYLKHIIPEYDYAKSALKKEEWLSCIPKSKRGRAELAMSVLESIHEHKEMKPYMDNVNNSFNGRPIDESLNKAKLVNNLDNQMDFQNNLIVDMGEKEVQENNLEAKNEHLKGNKLIEEEKLDAPSNEITA